MTPFPNERSKTEDPPPAAAGVDARVETYSFELDDDLVKVVTVRHNERSCRINVRYGRDCLLHEEDHVLAVDSPVEIERHAFGITLRARRRVFPFFTRNLIRRF